MTLKLTPEGDFEVLIAKPVNGNNSASKKRNVPGRCFIFQTIK